MRHRDAVVNVFVQANRGGRSREIRVKQLHAVGRTDKALRRLEDVFEHGLLVTRLEAGVLEDELGEILLHELGDVVAMLAMSVEHSIDRACLRLQDEPRVLVRRFRLEALAASVAHAESSKIKLIAQGLRILLPEGSLVLLCPTADAHLMAEQLAGSLDDFDDVLLAQGTDEKAVLVHEFHLCPRTQAVLQQCAVDVGDAETIALQRLLGRLRGRIPLRAAAPHGGLR
mmetsp:Transcript_83855/g.241101  ORF Transcript_83855/g.241101 Transcript_83855/m.241101 type:complete len:228 (+) Transcript_83855:935-1618(+)